MVQKPRDLSTCTLTSTRRNASNRMTATKLRRQYCVSSQVVSARSSNTHLQHFPSPESKLFDKSPGFVLCADDTKAESQCAPLLLCACVRKVELHPGIKGCARGVPANKGSSFARIFLSPETNAHKNLFCFLQILCKLSCFCEHFLEPNLTTKNNVWSRMTRKICRFFLGPGSASLEASLCFFMEMYFVRCPTTDELWSTTPHSLDTPKKCAHVCSF